MAIYGFDEAAADLDTSGSSKAPAPFWKVAHEGPKAILAWLNSSYSSTLTMERARLELAKKHLALYKGLHYQDQGTRTLTQALSSGGPSSRAVPKIIVNHLADFTEQRVSRISRFKPVVSILPASGDWMDKVSAHIVKEWVDYVAYLNNLDDLFQRLARGCYITGEYFVNVDWSRDKGPLDKAWAASASAAKQQGVRATVPYLDEQDQPVLDAQGTPQTISTPVFMGDVSFELLSPFEVVYQRAKEWPLVEWAHIVRFEEVEGLREDFPHAKASIQQSTAARYDSETMGASPVQNETMVVEFLHKPTARLPYGRRIRWLKGAILEDSDFPHAHGKLPLVRLTDIDVPGELHGASFYTHGKALNNTLNDMTSMARRNFLMLSHPKWMVPKNSVPKPDSLGNDIGATEFRGAVAPSLVVPPTIPQDYFSFREQLKQEMQQLMGVFDVSRGAVPKRIDSGVALQYLDEQENERANASVVKHQQAIKECYQLAIATAADHYEIGDERLITIVGKSKAYEVRQFDPSHLSKPFDVRCSNSNALPQSRAARTQTIIDLHKEFPDLINNQQALDMLEFGESEKFYDAGTVALRAAESEEEDLLQGKPVVEPQEYEDLYVHHQSHSRRLQNREFTALTPPAQRKAFVDHFRTTEYLMFQRALVNPVFAAAIGQLPGFPVVYKPAPAELAALGRQPSPAQQQLIAESGMPAPAAGPPPGAAAAPPPVGGEASMAGAEGLTMTPNPAGDNPASTNQLALPPIEKPAGQELEQGA